MGGHGALVVALKNTERYVSVSAFSPISNPVNCPWGQKALGNYLGDDRRSWAQYDASELMKLSVSGSARLVPALVDQGGADSFLAEQLNPEALEAAAKISAYPLELRLHEGYDHSYFFIASFIEDHLRFHAMNLKGIS
jgi:S-formylglutathione hydrolase